MCRNPVNAQLEQRMGVLMFSVISKVIEASLSAEQPTTTDVLASATSAYQQGKLTKAQYFAEINALDETTAATDPNYDYIKCHNLLNQYLTELNMSDKPSYLTESLDQVHHYLNYRGRSYKEFRSIKN